MSRVYIAGPISAKTTIPKEEKLRRFAAAADMLRELGHDPVNPLEVENECGLDAGVCAARTQVTAKQDGGQHGDQSHSWECYMRSDLRQLLTCDVIALLPGWDFSEGAMFEHEVAKKVGMPRMHLEVNLTDGSIYNPNRASS
jgi:hypothetical protein